MSAAIKIALASLVASVALVFTTPSTAQAQWSYDAYVNAYYAQLYAEYSLLYENDEFTIYSECAYLHLYYAYELALNAYYYSDDIDYYAYVAAEQGYTYAYWDYWIKENFFFSNVYYYNYYAYLYGYYAWYYAYYSYWT